MDPQRDKEGAHCSLLPLEDIWVVVDQVTAPHELRDLDGFCDG